jgi:tryptophan synthase alpha chain
MVTSSYVMQVSAVGVTGARSNVNLRVEHLLQEIKQVLQTITLFSWVVSKHEEALQFSL